MAARTTVLITGADTVVGRSLVKSFFSQDNHTVIAAVRDPAQDVSQPLQNLWRGNGSSLIVLQIADDRPSQAISAVQELESTHGIGLLDVVVSNPGMSNVFPRVHQYSQTGGLEDAFPGISALFDATKSLLRNAEAPKFIVLGSSLATLTDMWKRKIPLPPSDSVYVSLTQDALPASYPVFRKLTKLAIDPGHITADMGTLGAEALGPAKADVTVANRAAGMIKFGMIKFVGGITDGIVHMTGLDRAQFAVVNHVADMVKVVGGATSYIAQALGLMHKPEVPLADRVARIVIMIQSVSTPLLGRFYLYDGTQLTFTRNY